ncbi:hypothetical protein SAMN04487770_10220 [Butyrivibrio sp. ob235]|uniref:hypothetical protein n=1 Tax=Butyrivibrio sp. ob235 TaxID=1761780 RepID=UPI0008D5D138|nr:hypothetical protein [Butyrivibrio sp. ob235]SEK58245.1 hypothetical protein SAMN04487770_10220 [Butyrivibrio sp. ob235]
MVKVDNLVKNYGSFRLDVSMEIPDGTVTGIVGKNGAGKIRNCLKGDVHYIGHLFFCANTFFRE